MREIKLEVMFYTYNQSMEKVIKKHYTTVDRLCDSNKFFKQDLEILCKRQFTGLKDINGAEIYEGDIVKSHFYGGYMPDDIAQIEYDDSSARFIYNSTEQDAFVYGAEQGQLEVIGNIHENPELLKSNGE